MCKKFAERDKYGRFGIFCFCGEVAFWRARECRMMALFSRGSPFYTSPTMCTDGRATYLPDLRVAYVETSSYYQQSRLRLVRSCDKIGS